MIRDLEAAPPQAQEGFLEIITLPDLQPATLKALKKQQLQYLDG